MTTKERNTKRQAIIDAFRKMKPGQKDGPETLRAWQAVMEAYPEKGAFIERTRMMHALNNVRGEGWHPDDALLAAGELEVDDMSDDGLASSMARMRRENKDVDPTGTRDFKDAVKSIGGFGESLKSGAVTTPETLKKVAAPLPKTAIQKTINDVTALKPPAKTETSHAPLKIDGDLGPKTTDALTQIASFSGADAFTKQLGNNMGVFG